MSMIKEKYKRLKGQKLYDLKVDIGKISNGIVCGYDTKDGTLIVKALSGKGWPYKDKTKTAFIATDSRNNKNGYWYISPKLQGL